MNKTFLVLAALTLMTAPAFAAKKKTPAPAESMASSSAPQGENWYWGLGASLDTPVENFVSAFNLGFGGRLLAGYAFEKGLSLQLSVDNLFFSAPKNSVYDLRLVPELKGAADMGGWQGYLILGPGLDIESGESSSVSSFDLVVGPGAQFGLGDGTNLFVEWNLNFIFGNGVTGMDMPLEAGLTFPM